MPASRRRSGPTDPAASATRRRQGLLLAALLAALWLLQSVQSHDDTPELISLSQALQLVEGGQVERVETSDRTLTATLHLRDDAPAVTATYSATYSETLISRLLDAGVEVDSTPAPRPGTLAALVMSLLPVLLIVGMLLLLLRRNSAGMGLGKLARGRGEPVAPPSARLSDVAGCQEAIEELDDVVQFLRNPQRFAAAGATLPRGYLLVGPPGTGKTLLARAVAGEAGVPFFAVSGSEFVEVFVGQGAGRVRDLFERARKYPAAIVFIDEIDAVGRSRGPTSATGANVESENTLNQLLTEMDGFAQSNIIVLAATNRPDMLDKALTRAGRFDRSVQVPAPDREGRTALLRLHTRQLTLADDVDLGDLARRCPGMTGADIANLANRAALEAAKRAPSAPASSTAEAEGGAATGGQTAVAAQDFENALATLMLGRARTSAVLTPRDRRITAWHETGHALAALLDGDAADPVVVSIVPRGPAGGVTWMSGGDHQMATRPELLAQLTVALAGRAGEQLGTGGQYTAGAHNDLSVATGIATSMVHQWGMGERALLVRDRAVLQVDDGSIDEEVNTMLVDALERAHTLLSEHRVLFDAVANALLDRETLTLNDLTAFADEHGVELPDKSRLLEAPEQQVRSG